MQAERDTIAEREALEAEEAAALERERKRLEERKLQTRSLVVEQIVREEAAARAAAQVRLYWLHCISVVPCWQAPPSSSVMVAKVG
jgi:hypothetical protein